MSALQQRCDDSFVSETLLRAQYHGTMQDIAMVVQKLPAVEVRSEHRSRSYHSYAHTRTWQMTGETLGIEVPQLSIALEERYERRTRGGALLSETYLLDQRKLALAVNGRSHDDLFRDEGVKESSWDLRGERYRRHDVGRWRAYTPEGGRIARAVLICLAEPEKVTEAVALLRVA